MSVLPSFDSFREGRSTVAVVGLGYVGLPLAVAFARHFKVIGFDVNEARVESLRAGTDRTVGRPGSACAARPVARHPARAWREKPRRARVS